MTEQATGGNATAIEGVSKPGWRNFSVVPNQPSARIPEDVSQGKLNVEPARPTARSSSLRGIVFAGVGFLAGVAFWHTVGFWNFVSNVVLNGPGGEARVAGSAPITRKAPPRGEVIASPQPKSQSGITTGSVTTAPSPAFGAGSSIDPQPSAQ